MIRARIQICVAVLVALAVVIICVSPLAFSLPAPHQKHVRSSPQPTMGMVAIVTEAAVITLSALFILTATKPAIFVSERLALICVRLC